MIPTRIVPFDDTRARIDVDRDSDVVLALERPALGAGLEYYDEYFMALSPRQACDLGQALLDASREAGQAKAKKAGK